MKRKAAERDGTAAGAPPAAAAAAAAAAGPHASSVGAWGDISMDKIKSIMSKPGPNVTCVLLKEDGTFSELTLDMTPNKKESHAAVGCAPHQTISLLGQYCDLPDLIGKDQSIVIISRQSSDATAAGLAINKHKLQPPFDIMQEKGPFLLVKYDENVEPVNFSVAEWMQLLAKDPALFDQPGGDMGDEEENDGNDDDDDDDEDDDEDEDEEDEDGEINEDELAEDLERDEKMGADILAAVVARYKLENGGKEPSAEVLRTLQLLVSQGDDDDDEDEEEEDEEGDEEEEEEG